MSGRSKRRQDGYEAYMAGIDPSDYCDYPKRHWNYDNYFSDFKDGWMQAEKEFEADKQQLQDDKEDWELFRVECPWFTDEQCNVAGICQRSNCGLWYLRKVNHV